VITAVDARSHLAALTPALESLGDELDRLDSWGRRLVRVFLDGGRLLVAGNGGSAAEAQHLTAELVGRYEDERVPLAAIPLHGDTSSLTAIANDYGVAEAFARQVRAQARAGDVLLLLTTSGRSENVLAAARVARELGLTCWALTGRAPTALEELCDDTLAADAERTATIQEVHLVAIHLLCGYVESALRETW